MRRQMIVRLATSMARQEPARAIHPLVTSSTCILEVAATHTRHQANHKKCPRASIQQLLLSTLTEVDLRSDRRNTVGFTVMLQFILRQATSAIEMPQATLQLTEARENTRPKSPTLSKNTSTRSKRRQPRSLTQQEQVPELPTRIRVAQVEIVIVPAHQTKPQSVLRQLVRATRTLQVPHLYMVGGADTPVQLTILVSMLHIARSENLTTPQGTLAHQAAIKTHTTQARPRPRNTQQELTVRSTLEGQTRAGLQQEGSATTTMP